MKPNFILARPRGIVSPVRAEAADPAAMLAQLQAAHAEFRAEVSAKLPDADKLARLEASMSAADTALAAFRAAQDEQAQTIAALRLGAGGGQPGDTPEARQHAADFRAFMGSGLVPQARGATFSEPDGGFLIAPQVDTNITRIITQTVAMRGLARTVMISGASYKAFKSVGGAAAGWVGESEARTETATPTLKAMEFTPGELYAEPATTQQFLDDASANVESWYADEVATTFAEKEDAAFISGDGVKKPRGFLDYSPVDNASYAWGSIGYVVSGAASTFKAASSSASPADALIDLFHALRAPYRGNATFLMSDLTTAIVRKFKDGQGNFLWQPSVAVDKPSTLLGKPVAMSDNMPSVAADAFPVAFGDFNQGYLIIDKMGIRTLRNPYKTNGVVFFYTTKRVGGGVLNFEAIKLLKIST